MIFRARAHLQRIQFTVFIIPFIFLCTTQCSFEILKDPNSSSHTQRETAESSFSLSESSVSESSVSVSVSESAISETVQSSELTQSQSSHSSVSILSSSNRSTVSYSSRYLDSNDQNSSSSLVSNIMSSTSITTSTNSTVILDSTFIQLVWPNNTTLVSGHSTVISWVRSPDIPRVNLEYTTNGGASWKSIRSHLENSSYEWDIPNIYSTDLYIRVSAKNQDLSSQNTLPITVLNNKATTPTICSDEGNLLLYSNYNGGPLHIDVDVDIPDLKIGITSYKPVDVHISGTYANNVTAVLYAGYNASGNNQHCTENSTTTITGVDPSIVTIETNPKVTLADPFAAENMSYGNSCNWEAIEHNTPQQILHYFKEKLGGTLRSHTTQHVCFEPLTVSTGGNCCIGSPISLVPQASITITDPINKTFAAGEPLDIHFEATGSPMDIFVEIKYDDSPWYRVGSTSTTAGVFSMLAPAIVSDDFYVRLRDGGMVVYDSTTTPFSISAARHPYGTLIDPRDNKTYKTIEVAGSIWMAENLRYDIGAWRCIETDNDSDCKEWGYLYNFEFIKPNLDSFCPSGWRMPTQQDLEDLEITTPFTHLIAGGPWWGMNDDGYKFAYFGTNKSGFNIKISRYAEDSNQLYTDIRSTYFWTWVTYSGIWSRTVVDNQIMNLEFEPYHFGTKTNNSQSRIPSGIRCIQIQWEQT